MDYHERFASDASAQASSMRGAQSGMWTALPGIIQSVSLGQDGQLTASIQPAIMLKQLDPDGTRKDVTLPMLVDVPIVFPRGGPYTLTFPLAKDDEVLVVFASRCIDNWWQSGGVQPQHELRLHDLSDGFAIAGPFSQQTKIDKVSDKTAQLRSNDGTQMLELDFPNKKISVASDGLSIVMDSKNKAVTLDGPDNVTLNSAKAITIATPTLTLKGDLHVTGEVVAKSSGASVTLSQHRGHTTTGGPPTPGT